MKQYPKGGLIGKAIHLVQTISDLNVPIYAANAGFFIVLAMFPALVLVLGLLRYTHLEVGTLIAALEGFIPAALMDTAEELVLSTYRNSNGALVGLSAVTAVWSASRGVYGLLTGLNAIYAVAEDRGFFYTRFVSVLYTFLLLIVILLTLVLHVFGTTIMALVPQWDTPVLAFLAEIIHGRFFVLLFVQSLIFALMFTFLPNGRNRFRDTIPGALLASLGWLIFSDAYSIYVERFAGLSNIYGSVYAVALSMLWLYCCLSILFYAGALNQYLEDHR
jgi:membrane protein